MLDASICRREGQPCAGRGTRRADRRHRSPVADHRSGHRDAISPPCSRRGANARRGPDIGRSASRSVRCSRIWANSTRPIARTSRRCAPIRMFRRSLPRGRRFSSACCGARRVPVPEAERAAKWYRTAIDYLPGYVKARVHLAEIYLDQGTHARCDGAARAGARTAATPKCPGASPTSRKPQATLAKRRCTSRPLARDSKRFSRSTRWRSPITARSSTWAAAAIPHARFELAASTSPTVRRSAHSSCTTVSHKGSTMHELHAFALLIDDLASGDVRHLRVGPRTRPRRRHPATRLSFISTRRGRRRTGSSTTT